MNLPTEIRYKGESILLEKLFAEWIGPCDDLYLWAIENNEINLLKYLIQNNYLLESSDKCFIAIFYHARLEILHLFVSSGYIPNSSLGKDFLRERDYATNKLPLIKYLFEKDIYINYNFSCWSEIRDDGCISMNQVEIFDYFLSNNIVDQSSICVIYGLVNIFSFVSLYEMLLKHNPNMILSLQKAVMKNNLNCIEFLISKGADVNYNNSEAVKHAYATNNYHLMKLLLEAGANVDSINLLDKPMIKLLYDYGVRI